MNIGIIALLPCIENLIPLTCSNEKKEKKKRKEKEGIIRKNTSYWQTWQILHMKKQ